MEEKNSISSLTIRSINVNSICKNPKRAQILEFLRKIKWDIFIICDTRIEKNRNRKRHCKLKYNKPSLKKKKKKNLEINFRLVF